MAQDQPDGWPTRSTLLASAVTRRLVEDPGQGDGDVGTDSAVVGLPPALVSRPGRGGRLAAGALGRLVDEVDRLTGPAEPYQAGGRCLRRLLLRRLRREGLAPGAAADRGVDADGDADRDEEARAGGRDPGPADPAG